MTAAQTRILEMFRALTPEERETLLPELAETLTEDDVELSAEDLAAIEEGITQAERGEVVPADEVMSRLAARYGFDRA
jgi:hypothetical protein